MAESYGWMCGVSDEQVAENEFVVQILSLEADSGPSDKRSRSFMKSEVSSLCLQEPARRPYPESLKPSPRPFTLKLRDGF